VDDFASLVEGALRLSAKRPGRVWILSSESWTQTLSLSRETVAGLKEDQLGRALGFESEPFSGIPGLESSVGHVALPGRNGQQAFWLIQVPTSQMEQVESVVRQAGGKLVGLSHPGGIPRTLTFPNSERGNWQRVELWPGVVLNVRAGAGRRPVVEVRNVDPRPGRWEADAERWQTDGSLSARVEALHATGGVSRADLEFQDCLSFEEPDGLKRLLQAWAEVLAAGEPGVPVIRPPKRPVPASSRWALTAALALVAVVACVGHYVAVQQQKRFLETETARLREPADKMASLKKELQSLSAREESLKKDCAKLTDDLARFETVKRLQKQRVALLLSVLARQANEETVIHKIDGNENEIILHGVCLQHDRADALAATLADALTAYGWQVHPADKRSKELLVRGGPWQFDLRITDVAGARPDQFGSSPPDGRRP
jgi:cell division protein FtsB